MSEIVLHDYFRSSAAWRLRIGFRLKGLPYRSVPHHLRKGEQSAPAYVARNPQGLVPMVEADGLTLTQSLAILEWLEEEHPEPPLLPPDAAGRARVRSLALIVAADIHPIQNLRVLRYLTRNLGHTQEEVFAFAAHWVREGLTALESRLEREAETGRFCHGDQPGLADVCLVPQLGNARRFNVELEPFPTILRIEAACLEIPAFAEAAPERQPDAE